MKFFIVGLGLMGASYAEKLTEQNHTVYGFDTHQETLQKALNDKIIQSSDLSLISLVDVVILCLYPLDNVEFVKNHLSLFTPHQTITDIAGVKIPLLKMIEAILPQDLSYTSHHPMAGREKSGYASKDITMFNEANFIIIDSKTSKERDKKRLSLLAEILGFKKVRVLTKEAHDELIAYTSQLTHVIASAIINSHQEAKAIGATGDSFKDLTRIAKINAPLWTELFLTNKHYLTREIKAFLKEMTTFLTLLEDANEEEMIAYLNRAKKERENYD